MTPMSISDPRQRKLPLCAMTCKTPEYPGRTTGRGQIARAKNYIAEVTEKAKQIPKILNTGNYILDITLNSRLSEALERGIQVDIIRADAPPSLPMKDTDLSSILLNALDNAIRACNDSSNKNPWIRLDLHTKNNSFIYHWKIPPRNRGSE